MNKFLFGALAASLLALAPITATAGQLLELTGRRTFFGNPEGPTLSRTVLPSPTEPGYACIRIEVAPSQRGAGQTEFFYVLPRGAFVNEDNILYQDNHGDFHELSALVDGQWVLSAGVSVVWDGGFDAARVVVSDQVSTNQSRFQKLYPATE